jgi:hypothetical protein
VYRIPVVDDLAWMAVRTVGLFQLSAGNLLQRYYKPKDINQWASIIGLTEGGRLLFNARSPDELPSVVASLALRIGRVVILMQIVNLAVDVLKLVL